VPAEDRLVDQRPRRLGHRQGRGHDLGQTLGPFGQPKQPVGRDAQRERAFRDELGVGQARALGRKQLRNGGPVHARGTGEPALGFAALGQGPGKARPKEIASVPFVDFLAHTVTIQNNRDDMLRILPILPPRRKR